MHAIHKGCEQVLDMSFVNTLSVLLYILHIIFSKVGHVNFFVHVAHIQVSTNNED